MHLRRQGGLPPGDALPRMANQTPATIAVLKTFTEGAAKLATDAKAVAATKDESAITSAQAAFEKATTEVEKALEPNG